MPSGLPKVASSPYERRRRFRLLVGTGGVVGILLLPLLFVPFHSRSTQLEVASGRTTTPVSVSGVGWVTVHFAHPYGAMSMHYWMQYAGGMRYDRSMMGGGDSYSFWSCGGTYECGIGYAGPGPASMPVWVNVTWGVL